MVTTALKIRNYTTLGQAWDAEVVREVETDERFCYVPEGRGRHAWWEEEREVRYPERVTFGLPTTDVADELLAQPNGSICLDDCCCYLGGDWNHESIEVTARLVSIEDQGNGWSYVTLEITEA